LFILFIEAGANGAWVADQNYIKIPVGATNLTSPNGLSGAYAVDIDGDYIVDYVYAGDLKGNMWKFDLRDTTPTNWKTGASILYTASYATAGDQPITAAPVVGPHPNGLSYGVMVYFGTGKYLESTDSTTTNQTTQSFYAIWDKLQGATVTKSSLLQQTILAEVTVAPNTFRAISNNPINWNASPGPQNLGWYLNLFVTGASSNNGERQISQPILRNNNVIFTTMSPSSDLCTFGGSSWIMELDSASGGAPQLSPFDTNNDGTFDQQDYLTITINGQSVTVKVGGLKSTAGITGTPAVMLTPDKSKEIKITSGSQGLSTLIENPGTGPSGRQNWKQLY
jgi:type IV pilus assembly protein PilY1